MPYAALAIDLDGTLLVGDDLSDENKTAVQAAHRAGLEIIIATARWRQMAESISAQLGIKKPIIACSGAQVFLPGENRDIFDYRLPDDFVKALYGLCNQNRCIATITTETEVILKLDGKPSGLPAEMRWAAELDPIEHGQVRIAAIQGTGLIKQIKENLAPRFSDTVSVYDSIGPSGKLVVTITAAAANKGRALLATCEYLQIDPKKVIAFGDAENDIEMFKVSGASVAMGQAEDYISGLDMLSSMRLCANIPMQYAIQTALGGYQSINDLIQPDGRLYQQMELSYRLINEIPGLSCTRPKGAMYLFPKIDTKQFNIKNDEQFVLDFLREKQVLLVHGTALNWKQPDHFRIVFC